MNETDVYILSISSIFRGVFDRYCLCCRYDGDRFGDDVNDSDFFWLARNFLRDDGILTELH